jgi:hypothetical protein
VFGHVLADNGPMLDLCKDLGFTTEVIPDEEGLVRVSLTVDRGGRRV